MSGVPELKASCDGLCELKAVNEIPDMAESIDEVRGIDRASARRAELVRGGGTVE